MKPIRVLIADDSPIVLEGLRQLLEMQPGVVVVGLSGNGLMAVQQTQALCPDIVLLDIDMPKMSGLDALPLIKRKSPKTDVIMLSMHVLDAYVLDALHSGASGYVLKTADSSQIKEAISQVRRGCPYLSPQLIKGAVEKAYLIVRPSHCV